MSLKSSVNNIADKIPFYKKDRIHCGLFSNGKILCDFMFLIKLIIVFQNVMFIHQLLKFLW